MLASTLRRPQRTPTRAFIRHAANNAGHKTSRKPPVTPPVTPPVKPLVDDSSTKPFQAPSSPPMFHLIPPLQKPLGVPDVPTTAVKTWSEISADMLNQEKQLAKRRHLVKQASTGYFYDLHMTRLHGGKTWMAPGVLIRQDKALYFPDIVGTKLDDGVQTHTTNICSGRISVIAMLSTKISEQHAASYTTRVNEMYRNHPSYQYIQINLQENFLKSLLVNMFLSSLRGQVPPHLQPTYLISRQNMEYVREQLGMVNSRIGYVYLVDEQLKVRWAASADAKTEEEEALIRGVGVLLNRRKHPKKPSVDDH